MRRDISSLTHRTQENADEKDLLEPALKATRKGMKIVKKSRRCGGGRKRASSQKCNSRGERGNDVKKGWKREMQRGRSFGQRKKLTNQRFTGSEAIALGGTQKDDLIRSALLIFTRGGEHEHSPRSEPSGAARRRGVMGSGCSGGDKEQKEEDVSRKRKGSMKSRRRRKQKKKTGER